MARSDWRRPKLEPVEEGLRRIKITVSYDGSLFSGWQAQDGERTVEGELEKVLSNVLGEETSVIGSGRTDSGVSALGQVAHFDTRKTYPAEKFAYILNSYLPKGIRVLKSEEPEGLFHSRFTAMAREYCYFLKRYKDMLPQDEKRVTPISVFPSVELLNDYASLIFGTHDFTTFSSSRDQSLSKYRDIYESFWCIRKDLYGYDVLTYKVVGNAFLYHQVRSMVGTMLEAAKKGENKDNFKARLEAKDRSKAMKTAPSDGLYLSRISYDKDEYMWFEKGEYGRKI